MCHPPTHSLTRRTHARVCSITARGEERSEMALEYAIVWTAPVGKVVKPMILRGARQ